MVYCDTSTCTAYGFSLIILSLLLLHQTETFIQIENIILSYI